MRKKIAIVHPKMGWGGSEATVLWAIEALKNDYNVSLVTTGNVDIFSLNKYYGTNLNQNDFTIIKVPMPLGFRNTAKFSAIRSCLVQRYCQKISKDFDLMINNYNFCDFKKRSIQIATDIQQLSEIITLYGWEKIWYGKTFLRKIYLKICDTISPGNFEAWKNNFTLSNSDWTAKLIKEKYGIESSTLYPPVIGNFPNIAYNKRQDGFVLIGRIIPEKRVEEAIEILRRVRQSGFNIHLHIIGGIGNNIYANNLKKTCLENKDWLFFEGRVSEEKKNNLIADHKFGISCRRNEPFGIAVAEMVKAGCIVFVSNGGGQTEIVNDFNLIYDNINDAVLKIGGVLVNEKLQIELLNHLFLISQKFSIENFNNQIKNIVKDFLNNKI